MQTQQFVSHPLIKPKAIESRLFQEVIADNVLVKGHSLVVAPTALGKTVIAAMLAARLLEKFPDGKIVFLAPTKPLAVQHDKSFRKFLNLSEEKFCVLTGTMKPDERKLFWQSAQIIAATPQTIENDLLNGSISLADVSLLVFDECHRAVKDYSYVYVADRYVSEATKPLILGLTASPGSSEEKIQEVCKNLHIKNIELKTPKDEDVKPYAKDIKIEWQVVELPHEFKEIRDQLEIFLREKLMLLKNMGMVRNANPRTYGQRQLLQMQIAISKRLRTKAQTQPSLFAAASAVAAALKALHAIILLETQGISALQEYFEKAKEKSKEKKVSMALRSFLKDENMRFAMEKTQQLAAAGVVHPKYIKLTELLKQQFALNPESKVLVFNHYRDSIKNVVQFLKQFPELKPCRFVGQATKTRDKGMSQKEQIATIEALKAGEYNCLVASSVAEEGLDIPLVDLVIFFEAVPSEIRAIQRRGRTGRFATGRAVILLAKGTRDEAFYWSAVRKEGAMHRTLHRMKTDLGYADKAGYADSSDSIVASTSKQSPLPQQATLLQFAPETKDKVVIYADHREEASTVVEWIGKREDVILKVKQLEVGDYTLSNDIVVERKTVADFLQSLIDGRLFSQLQSMATNYEKPLLLLEGNLEDLYALRNIHKNAIMGALTSIALNYHVPVLFTRDHIETAEFLYVIAKREQLGTDKDIKLRWGRKGLTEAEQQLFIVESLPMIGPTMARALLKKFKTIKAIVSADINELQTVDNMGPKKAKAIIDILKAKFEEK